MARTRPGSDRPFRFPGSDDEPDEEGDDDELTNVDERERTSLDDLTTEADPNQFDRTFDAADANLTIAGGFDPVAGSRQVIPRIAYTINYNMIWNPSRGRWEPDTGNGSSGPTVFASGDFDVLGADSGQSSSNGVTVDVSDADRPLILRARPEDGDLNGTGDFYNEQGALRILDDGDVSTRWFYRDNRDTVRVVGRLQGRDRITIEWELV